MPEDDTSSCQLALMVAQEHALQECDTETGMDNTVGNMLGLDVSERPETDEEAEAVIEQGPGSTSLEARQYVFARVMKGENPLLDENDDDLYSALTDAWDEVNADASGEDTEPDDDEGEADDAESKVDDADVEGDEEGVDDDISEAIEETDLPDDDGEELPGEEVDTEALSEAES